MRPAYATEVETQATGNATVTGASPQWGDQSDASHSYGEFYRDAFGNSTIDSHQAYFAASGVDPAEVTAISCTVRGKTTNSTSGTARAVDVSLYDSMGSLMVAFGRSGSPSWALWEWPNDDAVHDNATTVTADHLALTGKTLAQVATALASPFCRLTVRRNFNTGDPEPFTYTVTTYDVTITLTHGAAEPPPTVAGFYMPTRVFPRHRSQQQSGRWSAGSYH